MAKKRRKKKKPPKSKKPQSSIPKSANPVRFLIFLAIGLILLVAFFFFAILKGNG